MTWKKITLICSFTLWLQTDLATSALLVKGFGLPTHPLLSGHVLPADHFHFFCSSLLLVNLYFEEVMMQLGIPCAYVQKFMNWLLLFTTGPLLLSVKGIIDLAQMPPTILLPHPGGTGTPSLERIAYLPGAQPPFPPRAFNPTSISPGENLPPPFPTPRVSLSTLPPSPCSLALLSAALRWPEVSKVSSEFSFCPFYCSRTGKSDSLNQHLHGSTLCSHIPTERPDVFVAVFVLTLN